jgi:uncharacterized protein DUF6600
MSFYDRRRTHMARLLGCALLLFGLPSAAHAQDSPPPYLAVVEGAANIDREDDVQPAAQNMPLLPGDRVSTLSGRVEILFPDSSALDLDQFSTVELLTPIRMYVAAGRAIFVVPADVNRANATRYEIDTPANIIVTRGFGTYRVDATSASSSWPADAFDQWAEARYGERTATASGQYLPQDLRVYGGTLDHYGSWQYDTSYGYVWYPSVEPAWRPYYNGYWEPLPRYGWTWIGADTWAWPTHHYGRWGHSRSGWYWIPGRTFGPAWVSWGAADGYVSWCPLGFDNRPVAALSVGLGFSSNGWVVVPRTVFGGRGLSANRYSVAPHRVPPHTAFIVQSVPPVAVPRDRGRRAALAAIGRTDGAPAASSNPGQGPAVPSANGVDRRQQVAPPGVAVPRRGVAGQRPVENPQAPAVSPQQPLAPPRQSPPAFRYPEVADRARSRTDNPGSFGRPPAERRVLPAVPRATVPAAPAVVPQAEPAAPPSNDVPRFRTPATMYGVPPNSPAAVSRPPQVVPRSAMPPTVAPPAAAGVPAPRMTPAAPTPSVAVPRAAPGAPPTPPAAAPPASPSQAPPPSHAVPSRAAPSRSGGGDGQAQPRRRG